MNPSTHDLGGSTGVRGVGTTRMLKQSLFSPAQPWRAETRLFLCIVLASFRPSTYPTRRSSCLGSLGWAVRRVTPRPKTPAPHQLGGAQKRGAPYSSHRAPRCGLVWEKARLGAPGLAG